MKKDDILGLTAGRETDELVASKVFRLPAHLPPPPYSTDATFAAQCKKFIEGYRPRYSVEMVKEGAVYRCRVLDFDLGDYWVEYEVFASTKELATAVASILVATNQPSEPIWKTDR
jgi:hypothetical protein